MSSSHLTKSAFTGVMKFVGGCTASAVIAAAVVVGTSASNPQPAAASASAARAAQDVSEPTLSVGNNVASSFDVSSNGHDYEHGIRVVRITGLGDLFVDVRAGIQVTGGSLTAGATIEAVTQGTESAVAVIGGSINPLHIRLSLTGTRLDACFLSKTVRSTVTEIAVDASASGDATTGTGLSGIDVTGLVDVDLGDTETVVDGTDLGVAVLLASEVADIVDLEAGLGLGINLGSKVNHLVDATTSQVASVETGALVEVGTPSKLTLPSITVPLVAATVDTIVTTDSVWSCSKSHDGHTIDIAGNDEVDESSTETPTEDSATQVKAVAIAPSAAVSGSSAGNGQTTTPPNDSTDATSDTDSDTSDPVDAIDDTQVVDDSTDDLQDDGTDGDGHHGHDHSHGILDCLPSIEIDLFAGIG